MENGKLEVLDTSTFDSFLAKRDGWISAYKKILKDYDETVKDLKKSWAGSGADAFMRDIDTVQLNLAGMKDILETMCDTLQDCLLIYRECDTTLGELNRGAGVE